VLSALVVSGRLSVCACALSPFALAALLTATREPTACRDLGPEDYTWFPEK
jgi:hypothetical protein